MVGRILGTEKEAKDNNGKEKKAKKKGAKAATNHPKVLIYLGCIEISGAVGQCMDG